MKEKCVRESVLKEGGEDSREERERETWGSLRLITYILSQE